MKKELKSILRDAAVTKLKMTMLNTLQSLQNCSLGLTSRIQQVTTSKSKSVEFADLSVSLLIAGSVFKLKPVIQAHYTTHKN